MQYKWFGVISVSMRSDATVQTHLKSFLCFLFWFKDKDKDKPPERRPFDRDKDLNLPRMSDDQKKSVIKKSKELGSRFQPPKSGSSYL